VEGHTQTHSSNVLHIYIYILFSIYQIENERGNNNNKGINDRYGRPKKKAKALLAFSGSWKITCVLGECFPACSCEVTILES